MTDSTKAPQPQCTPHIQKLKRRTKKRRKINKLFIGFYSWNNFYGARVSQAHLHEDQNDNDDQPVANWLALYYYYYCCYDCMKRGSCRRCACAHTANNMHTKCHIIIIICQLRIPMIFDTDDGAYRPRTFNNIHSSSTMYRTAHVRDHAIGIALCAV